VGRGSIVNGREPINNAGIRLIGQLVQKNEKQLLGLKNFGRKSLHEIVNVLSGMGLKERRSSDSRSQRQHAQASDQLRRDSSTPNLYTIFL
jgi:DNA-directed RNA polymerase alpha subunit